MSRSRGVPGRSLRRGKGRANANSNSSSSSLVALQELNNRCADCTSTDASFVVQEFRTCVCEACARIHNQVFRRPVRPIASKWNSRDLKWILAGGGNERINDYYEPYLPSNGVPPSDSDSDIRYDFLVSKYLLWTFTRRLSVPTGVLLVSILDSDVGSGSASSPYSLGCVLVENSNTRVAAPRFHCTKRFRRGRSGRSGGGGSGGSGGSYDSDSSDSSSSDSFSHSRSHSRSASHPRQRSAIRGGAKFASGRNSTAVSVSPHVYRIAIPNPSVDLLEFDLFFSEKKSGGAGGGGRGGVGAGGSANGVGVPVLLGRKIVPVMDIGRNDPERSVQVVWKNQKLPGSNVAIPVPVRQKLRMTWIGRIEFGDDDAQSEVQVRGRGTEEMKREKGSVWVVGDDYDFEEADLQIVDVVPSRGHDQLAGDQFEVLDDDPDYIDEPAPEPAPAPASGPDPGYVGPVAETGLPDVQDVPVTPATPVDGGPSQAAAYSDPPEVSVVQVVPDQTEPVDESPAPAPAAVDVSSMSRDERRAFLEEKKRKIAAERARIAEDRTKMKASRKATQAERDAKAAAQRQAQRKALEEERDRELKRLAAEAEKKRLAGIAAAAAEAEKRRLAVAEAVEAAAAERDRLAAAELEKKRLAGAAQAAEKRRLADEAEKKRLADEAEKQKQKAETERLAAAAQQRDQSAPPEANPATESPEEQRRRIAEMIRKKRQAIEAERARLQAERAKLRAARTGAAPPSTSAEDQIADKPKRPPRRPARPDSFRGRGRVRGRGRGRRPRRGGGRVRGRPRGRVRGRGRAPPRGRGVASPRGRGRGRGSASPGGRGSGSEGSQERDRFLQIFHLQMSGIGKPDSNE